MEPLDLRIAPPRGPREKLAGIVYTARLVDKLRASLPGGDLNGYLSVTGFARLWAHYTKIDPSELRDTVAAAASERDVERWIEARLPGVDVDRVNARMERYDTMRMPDEDREQFEHFYPAGLRERHTVLFDLLEADDARLYHND